MTQSDSLERFLSRVVDREVNRAALPQIISLSRTVRVSAGREVQLDQRGASLVYIASGAVKLVAKAAAEREHVAAFNFAGDLVTVPGPGPHAYGLYALVDSELIVLPYAALRDRVRSDPVALARLLDNCDAALGRCREKALMIGRKTASERMAGFLLAMAARIGVPQEGAVLLDLPMSRRDIGDGIGLTIETVSRQFSLLREDGLISTAGRSKVLLRDLPGLEMRAGHLKISA